MNVSPTKTTTGESTLPRLLYVGDVPVEPTLSGSSLLYRLFQGYPAGNLRIVEGSIWRPASKDRLPGVAHDALALGTRRLLYSRFRSSYAAFLIFTAKIRSHTLHDIVKNFRPEAIITVAHGFSWLAASALSNRFNLPLYLIIHDDWPTSNHLPRALQGWADKQFGRVYRQARLRLCVSPYMAEEYERRYGVPGNVLYPSRSEDAVSFDSPPVKHSTLGHPPIFAYAGSIYTRESAHALNSLASAIKPLDGRLVVFSTIMDESIGRLGLDRDNIEFRPVIPSNQLIVTLRNEVDALFLPMSFAECHGPNMKLSFPSKLADYTATGLPILIWAPPYSSAVRWARENEGAAEVVDNQNPAALEKAVKRLTGNGDHQTRLGKTALDIGRAYFSHDAACAAFRELVGSARPDKLHLGCGLNTAKDWINLDGSLNAWMAKRPFLRKALRGLHLIPSGLADVPWSPDIFIWNVRRPLPFQENSMSAIYASHLLEHLYFDESERLLKECFRLLRQGGVLRMLVPNGSKRMATLRRSANGPNRDYPFPDPDAPPRSVLSRMWAALRSPNNRSSNIAYRLYSSLQNLHQHKLLYDADSLVGSFRRAGFAEVTQMQAFQSRIEGIERIEIGERADSGSICIEGVKPGN